MLLAPSFCVDNRASKMIVLVAFELALPAVIMLWHIISSSQRLAKATRGMTKPNPENEA